MKRREGLSRRDFMKSSALFAAPFIVPASALGRDGHVAPSNRITMASIGVGGQGTHNTRAFLGLPEVQMLAVCDVDRQHAEAAQQVVEQHYAGQSENGQYKGCDVYHDFRDVMARDDIDALMIAPPDHWHALISIAAAKAGKDMYCEKPLANSIPEGRAVLNALKENGVVFQTGSHERSRDNARYAAELVLNGRIGKVHTIEVNLPVDHVPIGTYPPMPVPEHFDYDFWLGPAPLAPYTEMRCHFNFRYILDYSGGEVTDRGAHIIDLGQLGNGTSETGPISVEGKGWFPPRGLFNTAMSYEFDFEYANGVKMKCRSIGPRGVKFIGPDGWIFIHVHGGNLEAEPGWLLQQTISPDELHLGRSPGHHQDFINAVKTRSRPMAPAEVGHYTGSMCHLANIAMKLERKLKWDPEREVFPEDEEANRLLIPSMRGPWTL